MLLALLLALASGLLAQTPAAQRFDVISIKREPPGTGMRLHRPGEPGPLYPGGKYIFPGAGAWNLISFAYPETDVPGQTLLGLPDWAAGNQVRYDVDAEAAPGTAPTLPQMRQMMQTLLADRFQLKFHVETRRMSVFSLTVSRNGTRNITPSMPGEQYSSPVVAAPRGVITVAGRAVTMGDFAAQLWLRMGRPVIDRTGMSGTYDIGLVAEPAPSPTGDVGWQDWATVFRGQLGLSLAPWVANVPVMVVDRIEQPTGN